MFGRCRNPREQAERKPTHNWFTLNLRPGLPTAFRLNAPSGVRWNKWDERGGQRGREREEKQRRGGLKGVELTVEAGLHGRRLN